MGHGRAASLLLASVVSAVSLAASAHAQAPVHLVWAAEGGASELWARRVERRLASEGLDARTDDAWARGPADLSEARAALDRVEAALAEARDAVRSFDEARALAVLARARVDATRALALPGVVAWAAEVELAIGRVAAQSGRTELARASFARAFALAPGRALGAAEAAPEVVALADATMRDVRAAAAGRFEVDVAWDGRALVYLDDQLIGAAPRRVQTRAGAHVLRVEADGAEPYVAWIDVWPGTRPALSVSLSPTSLASAVDAAHLAFANDDVVARAAHVATIVAALGRPVVVWWVEGGGGPFERALVTPCDAAGCRVPARLETGTRESPTAALEQAPIDARARFLALAWRDEALPLEAPPPPPVDPWVEGWPWALVGTGAALVLGGVIAGIVIATEPAPDHRLSVEPSFPPGVFTP